MKELGWELSLVLLGFIAGVLCIAKMASDAELKAVDSGVIVINSQAYRLQRIFP